MRQNHVALSLHSRDDQWVIEAWTIGRQHGEQPTVALAALKQCICLLETLTQAAHLTLSAA